MLKKSRLILSKLGNPTRASFPVVPSRSRLSDRRLLVRLRAVWLQFISDAGSLTSSPSVLYHQLSFFGKLYIALLRKELRKLRRREKLALGLLKPRPLKWKSGRRRLLAKAKGKPFWSPFSPFRSRFVLPEGHRPRRRRRRLSRSRFRALYRRRLFFRSLVRKYWRRPRYPSRRWSPSRLLFWNRSRVLFRQFAKRYRRLLVRRNLLWKRMQILRRAASGLAERHRGYFYRRLRYVSHPRKKSSFRFFFLHSSVSYQQRRRRRRRAWILHYTPRYYGPYLAALRQFRRHRRPLHSVHRLFRRPFLKKGAFYSRKWRGILERFNGLFRGHLQGRTYDYPARDEKFRWPSRIRATITIHPRRIAESLARRSVLFGRAFRFIHHDLDDPTYDQVISMPLLASVYRDFYSQEVSEPHAPAPAFLFPQKAPLSLSLFWQSSWTVFDQDLLIDRFYDLEPLPTIWPAIIEHLLAQHPSVLRCLFLEDFAYREYYYWASFFCTLTPWDLTDGEEWVLSHPGWYRQQLERLALALPFFPEILRYVFVPLFRDFDSWCQRSADFETRTRLTLSQRYARFVSQGAFRQQSWFRRQTRYLSQLANSFNRSASKTFVRRRAFLHFSKVYLQLQNLSAWAYPLSKILKLFGPFLSFRKTWYRPLFAVNFSKRRVRFLHRQFRFQERRKFYRRELRRKLRLSAALGRREGDWRRIPQWALDQAPSSPIFFWKLLLFWLVAFYQKLQMAFGAFSNYRWFLAATSSLTFPLVSHDSFILTWTKISRFLTTRSVYRLACLDWSWRKAKRKQRRRKYFRRWFTGFFRRRRKNRLLLRGRRIPRYYRRFNFIRRLPFMAFRVFWPQSTNFVRRRKPRSRRGIRKGILGSLRKTFKPVQLRFVAGGRHPVRYDDRSYAHFYLSSRC